MTLKDRILLSVIVGILAGLETYCLPVSTIYNGAHLGDLWAPLFGIKNFVSGHSAYGGQFYNDSPVVAYPFTTLLALYPFSLVPLCLAGPLFFSLSSGIFAYALLRDGKAWKVLVLLSPSYIVSLEAMQFSPLLASAFLLPCLLPLACIKPHLGLVLCASGKWTLRTFIATILFVAVSLLIYPKWPVDWLRNGNLSGYTGKIPVSFGIGFLLLLSIYKWRDRRCRLLAAMSLIPQRLWYDQLMLFLIPETQAQLCILLLCSWLGFTLSMMGTGYVRDGLSWMFVVHLLYIPSLIIIYNKEIKLVVSRFRGYLLQK